MESRAPGSSRVVGAVMERLVRLLYLLTACCSGFRVSVPTGRIIAVRGEPAILGCEFTPDSTSDLTSLLVTWQRVEDAQVVHSFYYKQNQLEFQSPMYRNRTALFESELLKGNASLRIEPVGPRDAGNYLCTVSNNKGTDKAQLQLEYGAFYTEPRLSVNINSSSITLLYEAEGFPKPEVKWFGEDGEVLSDHTELSEDAEEQGGVVALYYLKSSYVSLNSSLSVTFRLKNQLLHQDLLRPVIIRYGGENSSHDSLLVVVLGILCSLLLLCSIFLVIKMRRKIHHPTNGTAHMLKQNEVL